MMDFKTKESIRVDYTMKAPAGFSFNNGRRGSTCGLLLRNCLLPLITLGLCAASALAQGAVVLVGSGSSVPAPLYNRWAQEFGKRNPNLQMRYLTVGTSEGIKQISHGSGDFAAGEAPLTDKERTEGGLIELPVVLVGIVPIYNLPEVHRSCGFPEKYWPRFSWAISKCGMPPRSPNLIRTLLCRIFRSRWSTAPRERDRTTSSLIFFPRSVPSSVLRLESALLRSGPLANPRSAVPTWPTR